MALVPTLFEIEPLYDSTLGVEIDKQVQNTKISMETYCIDEIDLFTSIKNLEH